MPPAEIAHTGPSTASYPPPSRPVRLHGWGGGEGVSGELFRADSVEAMQHALERADAHARGVIARGLGRSYGDAAQLENGLVLDLTAMDRFDLNRGTQTVTAQAGARIGALLEALMPAGWILPVVPGTQHVTVGGAIASDVHGKNHRAAGTFGSHVRSLGLLTATGEILELERDADSTELLDATIGGLGLTGVILWATIELAPVRGGLMSVDTDRVESIDEALEVLSSPGGAHRVAWLDLLGGHPGRGVVTRAAHVGSDNAAAPTVKSRARVPAWWPTGVLRPASVRAYNALRFRRAPRRERGRTQGFGAHMFPLDALDAWPRLYGRGGFVQYQLAVPSGEEHVLHAVVERLDRSGVPCFLAVLKDLGPANQAPLSFPLAGWTLALDLPRAAEGLERLLCSFDALVAGAGGCVYLTKDARLAPEALAAMYPRLEAWRATRDRIDPGGVWRSDLGLRTGLVSGERVTR